MLEIYKKPQLDERIWHAWIKKNEAQDKSELNEARTLDNGRRDLSGVERPLG